MKRSGHGQAKSRHQTEKRAPVMDELSEGARQDATWIAWEAPEFTYYEKGWLWSALVVAGALAFALLFWQEKNWSAIAVTIVAAIVLFQVARERPKTIRYSVDDVGLREGATVYAWSALKSFWLSDQAGDNDHLYLETTARWWPLRTIHLANVDPAELRARLVDHLPEQATRGEQFTDRLMHWLRF